MESVTQFIEQATHEHPLLVAPMLLVMLGVSGLALVDAVNLVIQIGTVMLSHYRREVDDLRATIRLINNKTVTVDTANADSVGELINALKTIDVDEYRKTVGGSARE